MRLLRGIKNKPAASIIALLFGCPWGFAAGYFVRLGMSTCMFMFLTFFIVAMVLGFMLRSWGALPAVGINIAIYAGIWLRNSQWQEVHDFTDPYLIDRTVLIIAAIAAGIGLLPIAMDIIIRFDPSETDQDS